MAATISFGPYGQDFATCMQQELASHKAGGPYNPQKCAAILQKGPSAAGGGIGLGYYLAGGALLVGGAAWYFFFRKPSAS